MKRYLKILNILSFAACIILLANQTGFAQCKIFDEFKAKKGVGTQLPDFSYAGVGYSEKEIQTPNYKIFDVTKFGAVANDDKSDKQAIIKAIKAAEANGSGIIKFPAGRFRINEDSDERIPISITKGNIVLKGAGAGEGGTEIFMKNHMQPVGQADREDGKYGNKRVKGLKSIFEVSNKAYGKALTGVTKDAVKGAFSVSVKDASKVKEGDWILLSLENNDPKVIEEGIAPLKPDPRWKQLYDIGLTIHEVHKVAKVEGKNVTFVEPLRFNLKSKWGFKIRACKFIEGVGVEDIAFVGNYQEEFVHHGSAIHDGGWKFWQMGGVNQSWVKDCRFKNCSGSISFNYSAYSSAINIKIEGYGGHTAVRESGSTGILIAKVDDTASVWHAVGVAKPGIGNVIWRCNFPASRCWESHATQPRATLFDCTKGGFTSGFAGGAPTSMPNHLHDLVLWNYNEIDGAEKDFEFQKTNSKYWKFYPPIIVGFHGGGTTFKSEHVQYIESLGKPVNPESLFEAQLALRLGKLPQWLVELKKN
ncbi:DUF4955 domain-containing protein [Puteibacter caeruleilacunae]|nr:DUF4955 domain-containing protein [Puteibacter caeruleilacunae]